MGRWWCVVILGLFGCGSDGAGATGDPLPASESSSLCATYCAHAVSCGWQASAATCQTGCEGISAMFRGDGLRAWLDCEIAAACSTQGVGEVCYVQVAGEVDARPVHDDYVAACTALPTTCPGIGLPGSKICDLDQVILLSDPYMTTHVLPCFDLACSQISMCLETNVLDAF